MKKLFLVPVLCLALLLPEIKALASSPEGENFCKQCGAALNWGYSPARQYTETHFVESKIIFDSNKNPVYIKCTITCVETPLARVCPNGHGAQWRGTCYEEFHSCNECANVREYR